MNDEISLWHSLSPVSVVLVTWEDIGSLVRGRSIVDLLFLLKHVLLLTKFVRLKSSQNSSNFPKTYTISFIQVNVKITHYYKVVIFIDSFP